MIQRRIEEHRIARREGQLDVVVGEVVDELGTVERDVPAGEALRVGQQHRRTALDGHVAVGDCALQRQHRRGAVKVRRIGGQCPRDEAEVVVAVRHLRRPAGVDDVDLRGDLIAPDPARPGTPSRACRWRSTRRTSAVVQRQLLRGVPDAVIGAGLTESGPGSLASGPLRPR